MLYAFNRGGNDFAPGRGYAIQSTLIREQDRCFSDAGFENHDGHGFLARRDRQQTGGAVRRSFVGSAHVAEKVHALRHSLGAHFFLQLPQHAAVRAGVYQMEIRKPVFQSAECRQQQVRALDRIEASHEKHERLPAQAEFHAESGRIGIRTVIRINSVGNDLHVLRGNTIGAEMTDLLVGDRDTNLCVTHYPVSGNEIIEPLQ